MVFRRLRAAHLIKKNIIYQNVKSLFFCKF